MKTVADREAHAMIMFMVDLTQKTHGEQVRKRINEFMSGLTLEDRDDIGENNDGK